LCVARCIELVNPGGHRQGRLQRYLLRRNRKEGFGVHVISRLLNPQSQVKGAIMFFKQKMVNIGETARAFEMQGIQFGDGPWIG
jgi:hypothetical protein